MQLSKVRRWVVELEERLSSIKSKFDPGKSFLQLLVYLGSPKHGPLHVLHHHQELGGTISRERGSWTKQQKQEGGTRLELFIFAILNFQF